MKIPRGALQHAPLHASATRSSYTLQLHAHFSSTEAEIALPITTLFRHGMHVSDACPSLARDLCRYSAEASDRALARIDPVRWCVTPRIFGTTTMRPDSSRVCRHPASAGASRAALAPYALSLGSRFEPHARGWTMQPINVSPASMTCGNEVCFLKSQSSVSQHIISPSD